MTDGGYITPLGGFTVNYEESLKAIIDRGNFLSVNWLETILSLGNSQRPLRTGVWRFHVVATELFQYPCSEDQQLIDALCELGLRPTTVREFLSCVGSNDFKQGFGNCIYCHGARVEIDNCYRHLSMFGSGASKSLSMATVDGTDAFCRFPKFSRSVSNKRVLAVEISSEVQISE